MNDCTTELCAICHEDMKGHNDYSLYEMECGHKFHAKCIAGWFRVSDGSCPYCRAGAQNPNNMWSTRRYSGELVKLWKRLARRNDCPFVVRKICEKIKEAKASEVSASKEERQLRRQNQDILNEIRRIRAKKWSAVRRWHKLERELVTLPPLPILRYLQPNGR